jgi:CrcB protein
VISISATPATRWDVLLAIGAGGALGSLARYGLSVMIPHARGEFAVATLATNVLGCLLIGVLMAVLTTTARPHHLLRPFLGVGVLGGFTTFSTAMVEVPQLLDAGRPGVAFLYLVGSAVPAVLAAAAGLRAARAVLGPRA